MENKTKYLVSVIKDSERNTALNLMIHKYFVSENVFFPSRRIFLKFHAVQEKYKFKLSPTEIYPIHFKKLIKNIEKKITEKKNTFTNKTV